MHVFYSKQAYKKILSFLNYESVNHHSSPNQMSLKLRLNILITLLLLGILILGGIFSLNNARQNAIAEIRSAEKLVLYLLEDATIKNKNIQHIDKNTFKLQYLGHMRHIRIELIDNQGKLIDTNASKFGPIENDAPQLFITILNSLSSKWESSLLPLFYDGKQLGSLIITPDPSYEYAEKWKQLKALMTLVLLFFVLVNVTVTWVVSLALKPTEKIYAALNDLEDGNLETRLPPFKTVELERIGQKFNEMVAQLQYSIQQNHRLSQELINLQEEERKKLARDLHDEFGQCLTAINTDATVIMRASENKYPELKNSALAISELSKHLIELVRGLLQTLRPSVLDELGLQSALEDLIITWKKRYPNIEVQHFLELDDQVFSDQINIAIFRLIQEALTNITKHAQATRVTITLEKQTDQNSSFIYIRIDDNGIGLDQSQKFGLGLPGMKERIVGIDGKINFTSQHGTTIEAWIPIK